MFALKKLLTSFLLPPGVFVLVLVAFGAHRVFVRRRKSGLVCIALGAALWAASVSPFSNLLLEKLESHYPIPQQVEGDVIVLLGGGVIDGVPDLSGTGVPTEQMYPRIVTAVRLQRRLDLPLIVSGGRIDEDAAPEAVIVGRFLVDLGVPEGRLILEDRSRDTYENAVYTRAICAERGFRHPILLTSAHHLSRSVDLFRKAGLEVLPFPAYFHSLGHLPYTFLSWLPSAHSLSGTAAAVHEYLGLLFYRAAY